MARDGIGTAESINSVLAGGGELGALMRGRDWSTTPLGLVSEWPQSLRSVISMLLPSKAQIILFWGPDFVCLYNDAYRPVFGAKHPDALGRPGREAWSEIWDTMLHDLLAGVVRTGEAFWAKDLLFILERHGFVEETYFDVSYDPVRVESGNVGGVYCIVTETTDRVVGARRMTLLKDLAARQTTARTTREVYAAAMEVLAGAPDIAFALAYSDGELQACTPDAEALLARASQTRVRELPVLAVGVDGPSGRLVVGLNPRRPYDDDYRILLELVANQLGSALANARAYEEERTRAEALAEIDRAKTAFFSNVSHEFRTPLTLILGPVEDMLTDSVARSAGERGRIELVHRNSLRLLKLVNTLLDFSRIEAGRVQAAFQPTDLASLTTDLVSAFRSAIERAGMELVVDCPPLGEPAYVDRDMWEKIVLNLMSNAFKYTLEGRIAVSLQRESASIVLSVEDTGVGIPERELPHVFTRFHRVEGSHGRTHEGTGIGLALVQELARLHGGTVSVASRLGAGSTFTVTIPSGVAHLPADRIEAVRTLSSTTLGAAPYVEEALRWLPQAPEADAINDVIDTVVPAVARVAPDGSTLPYVLLADDNADMRAYVQRLLSAEYEVEAVGDGGSALAAARRRRPDLIVADVMMPVLDGFGLVRELRSDADLRGVPVMLLSARAGEEARVEGWSAGADDYLVKPFSARELLARVESHLNLTRVRRDADAAIRASESRFRALVLASSDVVYRMNADWSEMRFLEGRAFIPDTQEVSRTWLDKYISPDDQPHVLHAIEEAIRTKSVFQMEHRVLRVDGTLGWTASRAIPILNDAGEIVEWFGTATDVTERKRIEEALHLSLESAQQARAEAQHANRMKDEFLTMLSHELRTPLNAILGWSQILTASPTLTLETQRQGLDTIERSARVQAQLIEDLLDVSRIAEGKLRLDVRAVTLSEVIEAALASVQPAADAKQIRVQMLLDRDSDHVNGDPARLQQVVWNLLSNAVKFTPKGGRVQVVLARVNSHVELTVSDNGEGIAPEFLPYVFDRFRQADQTTTRSFGGLGLGLSIVKNLVELHGGTVRVKSAGKGQGTSFIVELPLSLHRRSHDEGAVASQGSLEALNSVGTRLDGVTVLYVDDEGDARELVRRVLSDRGARVIVADSAEGGRTAMANDRPDVLVADIGMPGEDGYSLIRTIRAQSPDRGGAIPAAAMTALARPEDRRRALLAGFHTHVAKPVDVVELVAVVASLAGRTGR
jgi:signal transduction histidine kinase/PleD family two-component response regulator